MAPIPVTIVTGFLGSGKTTLILNLIPQLPKDYKLALLKNEFGDVAIDSQLASSASISAVQELLNGCICCNLVGQLAPALSALSSTTPALQRIIIETSGSAFPATLAMEINRLARSTGAYILDGVVSVIDVENWQGYEDTSYTAKMQARYTDLVVLNKWEGVGERRVEDVRDRVGDLEVGTAVVRSERGWVDRGVLLGVDRGVERGVVGLEEEEEDVRQRQRQRPGHDHDHVGDHQQEVEVLSVKLLSTAAKGMAVNLASLETFLLDAPKDEVYRIKAIMWASSPPRSSEEDSTPAPSEEVKTCAEYILNWAFGRWTFTPLKTGVHGTEEERLPPNGGEDEDIADADHEAGRAVLRMTVVLARGEAKPWRNKIEASGYIQMEGEEGRLEVERLL